MTASNVDQNLGTTNNCSLPYDAGISMNPTSIASSPTPNMASVTSSPSSPPASASLPPSSPPPPPDDVSDADGDGGGDVDCGIELTENFYINNNNKRKHNLMIQVHLNATGIYLRRETEEHDQITEQLIRMEDIIGSHCGTKVKKRVRGGLNSCKRIDEDEEQQQQQSESVANQGQKDISAYLYIYAYVRKEKPVRRMRTVRILRFRSFLTYEENMGTAKMWHNAIKVNKGFDPAALEKKPLLILLNPKSGSAKGRVMFQKQVAPVFKEAEVQYDLVVTTHANFAREFVRHRKDLVQKYSGIVVASGDGLFYEVLNGMMERPDWKLLAHHLPLGIIPCGSGNGLAKSIAHLYDEPYEPKPIVNSSLTCVSGQYAPLDVVRVELANKQNQTEMFSFLSVGWGLIADIDIESEKLRSIGAQRFTLWSIHRILRLRSYKGKLSYLPWREPEIKVTTQNRVQSRRGSTFSRKFQDAVDDENEPAATQNRVQSRRGSTFSRIFEDAVDDEHNFSCREQDIKAALQNRVQSRRGSTFSRKFQDAVDEVEGEEFDEFMDTASQFKFKADSWHSAASKGTAYYSLPGHSLRSHKSAATIMSKIEEANAEFNTKAPQRTIPALSEPLPPEWHTEEAEFTMVHAAYTPHLASDCFFAPDSKLNDGVIYLVIIRAGVSKSQLLQFLLNLSSGTHLAEAPTSHIQVVRVSAFRIEPHDTDGIMTVDGEKVEYGSIQGEILPGMVKVMVPNSNGL